MLMYSVKSPVLNVLNGVLQVKAQRNRNMKTVHYKNSNKTYAGFANTTLCPPHYSPINHLPSSASEPHKLQHKLLISAASLRRHGN